MIKSDTSKLGKYSRKKIIVMCDDCDKEKSISYKAYTSYGYTKGEYFCRSCKMKRNNKEKYGVDNVFQLKETKEKIKETNLERYGVDNVSKSEEIKQKKEETFLKKYGHTHHFKNRDIINGMKKANLEKYGVDNVSKLKEIQKKKEETSVINNGYKYIFNDPLFYDNLIKSNLEKYGVSHSLMSDEIKEKIKETNLERYGVDNVSKNAVIKDKIRESVIKKKHSDILLNNPNIKEIDIDNRIFKIYCDSCDSTFDITYVLYYKRRETNTEICTKCNQIDQHQSGKEIGLQNFIKSIYDKEIILNSRINNKELDIYLPESNIAFEFNGVYYHSDIFKEKNYHYDKTKLCEKRNIQLIHIWEDDWDYKKDLLKSMIKAKLGLINDKIYARKCDIKEVDSKTTKKFLEENHIQGSAHASIRIGLFYNKKLVSLMTFKKVKNGHQLNRFCNIKDVSVVGGASKLLNYFIKIYGSNIETFSDNSYSNGDFYIKLGFEKLYELKPDYRYVSQGIREHKFNFRNKDVSDLYKVYDAGKIKFKY